MAVAQDNELRATVMAVNPPSGFLMPINDANGVMREQWFTVSTRNGVVCPQKGQDIIVKYGISPASPGYEDRGPTYWANTILNPKLVEQNGGTYAQAHEQAAQAVDQQDAAEENDELKKDLSYDEREKLKNDGYNRRAALHDAVEFWKGKPIQEGTEDHRVVKTAQHYYESMFGLAIPQALHGHDGEEVPEYTG